ncbi:uncharacterized protein LOC124915200 isoform X2 [Impatiens glandulifera]|uniref:uncharacterized protein LOC124915200 isoform X2 n=1 Tax=Impatiens glandulifera TaxID=253017 RepID=UPI001FB079BA|nr:uncharacterized protein LOC124915200 isoform X2 [Impatiens glandulifera]
MASSFSGEGYAEGKICLGEIDVMKITTFDVIWNSKKLGKKGADGVAFYKPARIPEGYFCLGHYCQSNNRPLRGYLLVARELLVVSESNLGSPLSDPLDYTLMWNTDSNHDTSCCYVWLPIPPEGYKSMGFVVTDCREKPGLEVVKCVRSDLTEVCETEDMIFESYSKNSKKSSCLRVWNMRPWQRGMWDCGVSVGTFFCTSTSHSSGTELDIIACLKNIDSKQIISAMPNQSQVHSLIRQYGPRVFFHPDEIYMPSSVQWFFESGTRICSLKNNNLIDWDGANLPEGGANDGEYWIDLPEEEEKRDVVKKGNLESAKLYIHVKPALGGTFTDIAMWIFCPFNGPSTIKASLVNIEMSKVGEHVGDWEHFSLRISNFNGELWSMYVSQHSGGGWVDASQLEFIEGENRPLVYSSKSGHACFPHTGCYIQGTTKFGIGLRNDAAKSKYYIDSNIRYEIVAAEYLGDGAVKEPHWLQYMRQWGPTVQYNTWVEIDKIMSHFPTFIRFSVDVLFELFPTEIYGEEGPTGPKEKDNWFGDERC